MSRSGNVWDNAAMESVFSSLKTEGTARKVYRTGSSSDRLLHGRSKRIMNVRVGSKAAAGRTASNARFYPIKSGIGLPAPGHPG